MKISANRQYQNPQAASGFDVFEFNDVDGLARIVKKSDYCPAVFDDGRRKNSNFWSSDFLYLDIDDGLSIADFCNHPDFAKTFYIIITSRNHGKQKGDAPPCDRYHVLFPRLQAITNTDEMAGKLAAMIARYPFADPGAKDAARFFFGYRESEIIWHDGIQYDPPLDHDIFVDDDFDVPPEPVHKPRPAPKYNGKPMIQPLQPVDDKKTMIMTALRQLATSGTLSSYQEWIDLGMAMKVDGYSFWDWNELLQSGKPADSATLAQAEYKWDSFLPTQISGGTVMHYARMVAPELLVKGSMPPTPVPRISAAPAKKIDGYSTDAPTLLELIPDQSRIDRVYNAITHVRDTLDGGQVRKLNDGWYLDLIENDPELQNCAKYDYTVGGPMISYNNTTLLKTAIRRRMRVYGLSEKQITEEAVSRMFDEIMHRNRFHNRVLAFVKMLQAKHGDGGGDHGILLDQFLSMLTFQSVDGYSDEQVRAFYKEVFHIFFIRMHLHIKGTAMTENGGFYGLITNDIVPVLGGNQNIGKTTLCQWLACNREDMYVDLGSGGKGGFGTADTVRQVRGRMIAELGEMKIMRDSANVEAVKSFISKTKYELDVKYVEHSEPLPSTVSYIGTSNPDEYLSDVTGNRRFLPIKLAAIDKNSLAENMDLIEKIHACYAAIAEAVPLAKRFIVCTPSDELTCFIEGRRDEAMITYADHGAIVELVSADFEREKMENSRVDGVHKIQDHIIHHMVSEKYKGILITKNSIMQAMQGLGYTKKIMRIDGKSARVWGKYLHK